MPRELKIEKLNRKFGALTRSKDSIQSLSSWIILHKNFQNEVAEQWLNAVIKADISHKLTLFYLANDVLQNCKRKGAVEFRTSFAEVLEEALAYARDEGIRDEILRMITIWGERKVLSPGILQLLQDQVNKDYSPIIEEEYDEPPPPPPTPPLTEEEVITTFEPQNLRTCLEILKQTPYDFFEKMDNNKEIMSRLEISQLNLLDIRINSDMHETYKKLEKTMKVLEDCIKDIEYNAKENRSVLRMVEIGKVFYLKQNEDVKRVAQAYRIFSKKLRNVKNELEKKRKNYCSPIDISLSPIILDGEEETSSSTDKIITPKQEIALSQTENILKDFSSPSTSSQLSKCITDTPNSESKLKLEPSMLASRKTMTITLKKKVTDWLKLGKPSESKLSSEHKSKPVQLKKNKLKQISKKKKEEPDVEMKDNESISVSVKQKIDKLLESDQIEIKPMSTFFEEEKLPIEVESEIPEENSNVTAENQNDDIENEEYWGASSGLQNLEESNDLRQNEIITPILNINATDIVTKTNEMDDSEKDFPISPVPLKIEKIPLLEDVILLSPILETDIKKSYNIPINLKSEKKSKFEEIITPEKQIDNLEIESEKIDLLEKVKTEFDETKTMLNLKIEEIEVKSHISNSNQDSPLKISKSKVTDEEYKINTTDDKKDIENSFPQKIPEISQVDISNDQNNVVSTKEEEEISLHDDKDNIEVNDMSQIQNTLNPVKDNKNCNDNVQLNKIISTEQYLARSMRTMVQLLSRKCDKYHEATIYDKCVFPLKSIFQILNPHSKTRKHSLSLNEDDPKPSKKCKFEDSTIKLPETYVVNMHHTSKNSSFSTDVDLGPMDMELDSDNED